MINYQIDSKVRRLVVLNVIVHNMTMEGRLWTPNQVVC